MRLILLLLLAMPASGHMVAFPHSVTVIHGPTAVELVHTLQVHPGPDTAWLGPFPDEDMKRTGTKMASRLLEGGPRLTFNGKKARCQGMDVQADARSSLNVTVRILCKRPGGALKVELQGKSKWSTGLVPVTVHGSLTEPTLEGEGAPLGGRDPGPWVGGLIGGATLGWTVPDAPVKMQTPEET